MPRLVILPAARADLIEIGDFIAQDNPGRALSFLAELEANRIPAGPVYTPQQALDDPHIKQANFLHDMEYPGADKPVPILQEPVRLSRTPLSIRRRAPQLGEHTDQILEELGYDAAAIRKLRADRVV